MPLPIASMDAQEARDLHGLLFDLDDTLLDRGELSEAAYGALFRLRESGLVLLAVTGRPASFCGVVARQWPVAAVVAENGGLTLLREGGAVRALDPLPPEERRERRARLQRLALDLRAHFPDLVPADELELRLTDVTFDIGERRQVAPEVVRAAVAHAEAAGCRTAVSTVHLHVTLDEPDKAAGSLRTLSSRFGVDPAEAVRRYAFMGDSDNDAACFAAFHTTIAPSNFVAGPSVTPRYVTTGARGEGFVEAAATIIARRRWQ